MYFLVVLCGILIFYFGYLMIEEMIMLGDIEDCFDGYYCKMSL